MAIVPRKRKDGSTRFQVKVKDPLGKWYPTHSFIHRDEAVREEAKLLDLKRKGARSISDDARITTVSEYSDVWSQENRSNVSPGWKISQDQMWRDYVKPIIG